MLVFAEPERSSNRKVFGLAVLFSALVHFLIVGTFPFSPSFNPTSEAQDVRKKKPIKVARVKPFKQLEKGQLVDVQDDTNVTNESVDTNFLSDKNRKVKKQTKALDVGKLFQPSSQAEPTPKVFEKQSKYSLNLPDNKLRDLVKRSSPIVVGPSNRSNYLPGIEIGEQTLLDTKSFALSSFFLRMKGMIEDVWSPQLVVGRNHNLHGTYITVLDIVMDEEGYLIKVNLVKSSGIDELDREAIRAVQTASPFLNPPKELLEDTGHISMPPWSFIVDRTRLM